MAVGYSILVILYHLIRDWTVYDDHGPRYFIEREREGAERRLVRQLEGMGCIVTLEPDAP